MTEEFLHYIWKHKLLSFNLKTLDNESLVIQKTGQHNHDAGPDFLDARIIIGDTKWAGNVEIHINSSDWYKHQHHLDRAYDSIILHVVYRHDRDIFRSNQEVIPVLEIREFFNSGLYEKYMDFMSSTRWVACENLITTVNPVYIKQFFDRLVISRLERKTIFIRNKLKKSKNDWEQIFYEQLSRNFGFRKNSEIFESLARATPVRIVAKHKDNLLQLESLFYGQAGMLNRRFTDDYPQKLKTEYLHLKSKFSLTPVDLYLWKFMRLRPLNFPTIRISQLAGILNNNIPVFSRILEADNIEELYNIFDIKVSEYWESHYQFDRKSVRKEKKLGHKSVDLILINTVIPFVFLYGKTKNEHRYIERCIDILTIIKAENNIITRKWKEAGIKAMNAFQSQALIELYEQYCMNKSCLHCGIGHQLINR